MFETPDNGPVPEEESIRAHPAEPDASAQRIRAHPAEPDASAQPVTSRDEAAEPSGEEDPANEKRILEEKEQAENSVAPSTAEDPLAQLQRERDEYLDLARRAQADFENYRKRAAREAAAAGERAKSGLVRELLPIVDNLERALASAGDSERHLAEGVQLVHAELLAVLERNGIEQFDPRGDRFDPGEHEALSMRAEDGAEPGVVLDVMEKGYRSNGNVLRPARVVVSG
ncbi:MAG: molecular chaperone GrpE [Thermoleophilaceae bacterium]|nr:molecular chaperone GrpE [Thermoleophilaceae bacterium]